MKRREGDPGGSVQPPFRMSIVSLRSLHFDGPSDIFVQSRPFNHTITNAVTTDHGMAIERSSDRQAQDVAY